jgi:hypothetical protein
MQWIEISRDVYMPEVLPVLFGFGFTAVGQSLYAFGGLSQTAGEGFENKSYPSLTEN